MKHQLEIVSCNQLIVTGIMLVIHCSVSRPTPKPPLSVIHCSVQTLQCFAGWVQTLCGWADMYQDPVKQDFLNIKDMLSMRMAQGTL